MGRLNSASEHHEKQHRQSDGRLSKMESCFRCIEAHARCASKIVYRSREEADKKALLFNVDQKWWPGACQLAYRCRWSVGKTPHWHTTSATTRRQQERVEKMRQRWLRKTGQKDHEWGEGEEYRWRFYRPEFD